ncbi:unnamed protein product [Brassica oleracea var. botrytis]
MHPPLLLIPEFLTIKRQLKNKDEDGVSENNEGLPRALLGSCNDRARHNFKLLSLSHFIFYHSYVFWMNHEKEKMKQEIERKEEEIKNLGEKVREDEKENERNSFCRSHWKVGNSKARRYLRNMRKKKPIPFSHKFPRAEPLSLHLPENVVF